MYIVGWVVVIIIEMEFCIRFGLVKNTRGSDGGNMNGGGTELMVSGSRDRLKESKCKLGTKR